MSEASWKAHFSQPISGYDPVEAQGLSELGFALQHSQIPQEEYLKWARETFELASLDMKFFQTHPAPKELYEKWKDVYAWGPECLPIGEWEEHLLVAGLIKPQDIPAELKPIFLLAPVSGLISYWQNYQDDKEKEVSPEESAEVVSGMPEGFDPQVTQATANEASSISLNFTGVTLLTPEKAPEKASEKKPEKKPETKTVKPEPAAVKIQVNTQNEIKPLSKTNNPAPVKPGLIVPPATNTEQIAITTPAAVSTSSYTMPPLNPKVPPPSSNAKVAQNPASPPGLPQMPQLEKTIPEIKAEPQVLPAVPAAAAVDANDFEIEESLIHGVFAECSKQYEKLLYIKFSEAGKFAIAKYWPKEFVAAETPTKHTLSEDSFLAIVAKTQKPYHGYVIKNAITDHFFVEVNSGQTPENITLVPFIKNDVVVGALMGWGPKTTYNLTVLRSLEKAVFELTVKLGWVTPEAA